MRCSHWAKFLRCGACCIDAAAGLGDAKVNVSACEMASQWPDLGQQERFSSLVDLLAFDRLNNTLRGVCQCTIPVQ